MALDTDAKRFSALNVGNPWRGVNYFPTGTVDAAERLALVYLGSSIVAEAPVEVPDVVGETQAAGTTTLETALFVVAVETAYSDSVAEGLIISQSPTAGSFANSGSTVTITVSLGPEPVAEEPIGGHFIPQKDYRPELDARRIREREELRELIARAAGLIEDVEEAEPEPAIVAQVAEVKDYLETLSGYADAIERPEPINLEALQARVDQTIAQAVDAVIVHLADVLTDLIQEITEDPET